VFARSPALPPAHTPMRPQDPFIASRRLRALALGLAAGVWSCTAAAVDYRAIAEQNLFDPQRKPWPEPAAASAVTPFGPEDIQVQGVVVIGGVKRAIVKFGGRLRQIAPGGAAGRLTAVLSEGQSLGGYTLESIEARQLVFASGGNRLAVAFTRNAPREMSPASQVLPVIQSATLPVAEPVTVPVAQPAPGMATAPAQFPSPAPSPTPSSTFTAQPAPQPPIPFPAPAAGLIPGGQPAAQQPGATAAAPASPDVPASPAGGMTLLQAIQAAEAARRSGQLPAAPAFNPFQPRPQP